ncbi:MAG: hypothetical protein M4579_003618 [Chaenotheca gracillima]|nr:MAG: hypothetical protein M4579_003618 [Chaenotheca gracillima]
MHSYVYNLVVYLPAALVALVIYTYLSGIINRRLYLSEAKRRGCEDVPMEPTTLPFGIDRLQAALKADREQQFPPFIQKRFKEIGRTTFRFAGLSGSDGYFTYDPKNIQAILATQFNDFALGSQRRNNFFPLLGTGIFTSDGKAWEHSRAMMRPQFARDQVSDLDLEESHVQNLMKALPVDGQGWSETTDLQVLFFRLTLDSATEFLFGESVDSQLAELPAHLQPSSLKSQSETEKQFPTAFDLSQRWLATRGRFQDKYWLVTSREFRSSVKTCHNFVDRFVRMALNPEQKDSSLEKGGKEKYVFLEALATQTRDPVELRSQLMNILLAGRDTTASLLGWLFYILVRDQGRFDKLRAIILEQFGTFNDPEEITFAKLKACQYLQWCLNETLRLYPVVPINGRMAQKDTTLPRGGGLNGESPVLVKKGQSVAYSVHVMHRAKEYWGEDADQFALTEASYVAVRLIQRFDKLENLDTEPITRHNLGLTNCSGTGVQIRMHQARE